MSNPNPFPFECENCGCKPTPQEVIDNHGVCAKCGDTVIAYTVDAAECIVRLMANDVKQPRPTESNYGALTVLTTPEAQPALAVSACSATAMRAAHAILSGSEHGAIRWHGPDADNQWCWQYRRIGEVAAIIDREMQTPNR